MTQAGLVLGLFSIFGLFGGMIGGALTDKFGTAGEMVVMPTMPALAANFAPEDMRGRYMAVFGLTWMLPATFGPGAAGVILDNFNPNLLWYIGGVLCAISALGFASLHSRLGRQERFIPAAVIKGQTPG